MLPENVRKHVVSNLSLVMANLHNALNLLMPGGKKKITHT